MNWRIVNNVCKVIVGLALLGGWGFVFYNMSVFPECNIYPAMAVVIAVFLPFLTLLFIVWISVLDATVPNQEMPLRASARKLRQNRGYAGG